MEFELGVSYTGCVDRAQRWAVLAPLCGPAASDGSDSALQLGILDLIQRRRQRFQTLRRLGWSHLLANKNWTYALNCPPITLHCRPQSRPCHQRNICPFCWGRHIVRELCSRLEYTFYGGPALSRERKVVSYELVEVMTYYQFDDSHSAHDVLQQIRQGGNALVKYRKSLGAYCLHSVVPLRQGWRVTERVLWVIPEGSMSNSSLDEYREENSDYRRTARLTPVEYRTDLAAAAGRICRYPVELLTSSAEKMVRLLNAHRELRVRLSACYGELRNTASQQRQADRTAALLRQRRKKRRSDPT